MFKAIVYAGIFGDIKGVLVSDWGQTMYVRLGERHYEVEADKVRFV